MAKREPQTRDYPTIALNYAKRVVSGKILACNHIKLACQRHINDLDRQKDKGFPYEFNPWMVDSNGKKYRPADRKCAFTEKLPHTKGKWMGEKIILEDFQVFVDCCIWGWVKKKNKKRRFTTAYIKIPRKNGKSLTAAAAGLYMLAADGEKGSEVYCGATSEKQALEVFRPAWQMAQMTPALLQYYGLSLSGNPRNPTSIYRLSDMSRFEPIIGNPGDGASPHCAIEDEMHEHKTANQYDTMSTGMGAREQPLMYVITTAGEDTSGPCYELELKAIKVLEGTIQDDEMFVMMFGIDPEDSFEDFNVWKKANPNFGISISEDYLLRKWKETLTDASKQNTNLRKHLNVWTNAGVAWMNMSKWSACSDTSLQLEDFNGMPCYAALDLASKIDLCALMLLFKTDRGFVTFGRYYLPEETVNLAGNDHYVKWVKEGYITETDGARTDFKAIEDDLAGINKDFPIQELCFDPREASYLIANIQEWASFECVEIPQGPAQMSEPMKELEAAIYAGQFWFDGDPVLTWMMGNVVKKQGRSSGPVKYYYPTKERAQNKIDGVVAIIMAMSRAMANDDDRSTYEGMTEQEMLDRMRLG